MGTELESVLLRLLKDKSENAETIATVEKNKTVGKNQRKPKYKRGI